MSATVLVIDDNEGDVALLRSALECDGNRIQVDHFASTAAATPAVIGAQPGSVKAIILDLGLPIMDGAAWLRAVGEAITRLAVPVVLWTGSLRDEAALRALSPHIRRVIRKPMAWSDLRSLVRELRSVGAIAA